MKVDLGGIALVLGGLLEVDTIVQNLSVEARLQNLGAEGAPARGVLRSVKSRSNVEEAQRLAGEMGVRTEVRGQVTLDMQRVQFQACEPAVPNAGLPWPSSQHREKPAPGNCSIRDFQTAGPIHTQIRGIFLEPRRNVTLNQLEMSHIAVCQPAKCRRYQILMAIDLPEHLVVAHH
ncbi:MAG: hypothetical protein ABI640_05055 [Gammaproteobacteria bacterium]